MNRMKKSILTTLVIFISLTTLPSSFAVEYQSPRTLALGGSGRAAPLLNDSILMNPSYASFTPIYSLSTGYTWYNQGRNYNVSVQDSRTEMFQAGASFTKREQNAAINIGASRTLIERLGVGLGSKFILDNGTNKMTSNFLFSTSYIGLQYLYSALIIDNLLEGDERIQRKLYRTFFVGLKFIPTKEVEIFLDPFYSPNYTGGKKAGYSVGVEFGLMSDLYLRMGKFQDAEIAHLNTRGEGFGLGMGWIGPRINFDYSMNRVTASHAGTPLVTAHAVSTTIFF